MEDNRKPARRPRAAAARGPAPKKAVAAGKAGARKATATKSPVATTATTTAEREQMIRTAAYFRAERRGFAPGYEWEDWLAAEAEVQARAGARQVRKAPARAPRAS